MFLPVLKKKIENKINPRLTYRWQYRKIGQKIGCIYNFGILTYVLIWNYQLNLLPVNKCSFSVHQIEFIVETGPCLKLIILFCSLIIITSTIHTQLVRNNFTSAIAVVFASIPLWSDKLKNFHSYFILNIYKQLVVTLPNLLQERPGLILVQILGTFYSLDRKKYCGRLIINSNLWALLYV